MRYKVDLATEDPFPQDARLGAQLEDEEPIEVPDECPETPCEECPPGCEVECWGWLVTASIAAGTGGYPYLGLEIIHGGFAYRHPDDFGPPYAPDTVEIVKQQGWEAINLHLFGNFCGHKLRYVVDLNGETVDGEEHYTQVGGQHGEAGVSLFGFSTTMLNKISIIAQIDLTDAELGEETWTTLCGTMKIVEGGV